jgi:hypothetical protein
MLLPSATRARRRQGSCLAVTARPEYHKAGTQRQATRQRQQRIVATSTRLRRSVTPTMRRAQVVDAGRRQCPEHPVRRCRNRDLPTGRKRSGRRLACALRCAGGHGRCRPGTRTSGKPTGRLRRRSAGASRPLTCPPAEPGSYQGTGSRLKHAPKPHCGPRPMQVRRFRCSTRRGGLQSENEPKQRQVASRRPPGAR